MALFPHHSLAAGNSCAESVSATIWAPPALELMVYVPIEDIIWPRQVLSLLHVGPGPFTILLLLHNLCNTGDTRNHVLLSAE